MNIKNLTSGYSYVLSPDTKLKVERTNPFFNEYGEQTLPVSIPDTPQNRKAMNYPSILAGVKKHDQMQEVSIQDGEYYMVCRQALLGSKSGDKISTSFYMNEGSFFSKLKNTYITDVFKGETVPGVETLDQAINYLKDINEAGGNEMFSIFEVRLKDDDNGKQRWINGFGHNGRRGGPVFDNENETNEVIDGKNVTVPRGFYLSPFLKVNYVLKRLFHHFGYTLQDSLFTQDPQFKNLVFINNVADAIVMGTISLAQLIPEVSCSEILSLFRKKFCCEFIPDELSHTVSVVFLKDIIREKAVTDLSEELVDTLQIDYPEEYKQIILEAESKLDDSESSDSLAIIKSKYPTAQFNDNTGCFMREGFSVTPVKVSEVPMGPQMSHATQVVGDTCQRYYEGGNNPTVTVKIPECFPNSKMFIGQEQFVNSSMNIGNSDTDNNESDTGAADKNDNNKMHTMIAFAYKQNGWGHAVGSVTNYAKSRDRSRGATYQRFGDYSLVYNGDDGIFEKFYRDYDTLLRNSMHVVKAKLLLSQHQKLTVPSFRKVVIKGSSFLLDSFNYVLGGKNVPVESKLLSLQLFQPVVIARKVIELFPPIYEEYVWKSFYTYQNISYDEYENSPFKDAEIPPFYPVAPDPKYIGQKMYTCHTARAYYQDYTIFTFWLEVVAAPAK